MSRKKLVINEELNSAFSDLNQFIPEQTFQDSYEINFSIIHLIVEDLNKEFAFKMPMP